jgi:hypothetical protein
MWKLCFLPKIRNDGRYALFLYRAHVCDMPLKRMVQDIKLP